MVVNVSVGATAGRNSWTFGVYVLATSFRA